MKALLLSLLMLAATVLPLSAQSDYSPQENSLLNCITRVRFGLEQATPQGMAYDYTPYVDTLYNYLYTNPVEMKVTVEMLARLLFAWIAMQAGSYLLACACDPAAWLFAAVFLAASYKRVLRRMEVEWGCSP